MEVWCSEQFYYSAPKDVQKDDNKKIMEKESFA